MKIPIVIIVLLPVCVVNVDSATNHARVDPSVRVCELSDCSSRLMFWDRIQAQEEKIKAQTEQIQAQGKQIRTQEQQIKEKGEQIQAQGKQIRTQEQQIKEKGEQIKAQGKQIRAQEQQIESQKKHIDIIQKQLPPKPCPYGFEYLSESGQCLKLFRRRMNWTSSRDDCTHLAPGAKLAAITSHTKQLAVKRYLENEYIKPQSSVCYLPGWSQGGKTTWIGGQTKDPSQCGNFVWKPRPEEEIGFTYTNWNHGEPGCVLSGEHCVIMASGIGFRWNASDCHNMSCFVCEI